jgi:hypothetical protein
MKIPSVKTHAPGGNRQGSVLLVVLLTVLIIGTALASYLVLVSNQHATTTRSLAWNSAVGAMEAGVEEALTQIRYNGIVNLVANHWTLQADGLFHKTGYLTDRAYYDAAIEAVNPPVIWSTGYVPAPMSSTDFIRRRVRVTTLRQSAGAGGVNARNTITFSGGGYLDSYDASITPKYDPTKRRGNGLAISNAKTSGAIAVGTGKIYGNATTGAGGTVTFGAGGAVGDSAWIAGGNVGAQPGHVANDANLQFDAPVPPYTYGSGWAPSSGLVAGYGATNWSYVCQSGNYDINKIAVSNGANPMLVTGNVTLYVSTDFTVSGSGFVYVAPGATLTLYVVGKFTVSGDGVVNGTGLPKNVSVYGLNTTTQPWTYSGSADFLGTVYAPLANFTISGGASGYGSFTANSFTLSGSGHISYDESLSSSGNYVVASWNEM